MQSVFECKNVIYYYVIRTVLMQTTWYLYDV